MSSSLSPVSGARCFEILKLANDLIRCYPNARSGQALATSTKAFCTEVHAIDTDAQLNAAAAAQEGATR